MDEIHHCAWCNGLHYDAHLITVIPLKTSGDHNKFSGKG